MLDINLNDKKYLEGFSREFKGIMAEDNINRAEEFYFYLERILAIPEISQQLSKGILDKYNKMILLAKIIALPKLNKNEIYRILTKHLSYVFNMDGYDIWGKIKIYLLNNNSLEERDNFKEGIRKKAVKKATIIAIKMA